MPCLRSVNVSFWGASTAGSAASHAKIVGAYFRYSADWAEVGVADVSPDGWVGQRDPMVVVVARKRG